MTHGRGPEVNVYFVAQNGTLFAFWKVTAVRDDPQKAMCKQQEMPRTGLIQTFPSSLR